MRCRNDQRGSTTLLYTLALTVMLGMVGLTVDVGWMYYREQAVYAAAESAALGAVQAAVASSPAGITCGVNSVACQSATACGNPLPATPATNMDNGCMYAKDNGFAVGATRQNVLMAGNTTASPVAGLATGYWASATVVETVPQTFAAVLGRTFGMVSRRATAAEVGAIEGGCAYVLSSSAQNALVVSGSASLVTSCGVYVESSNSKAVQVTGSGTLVATSGGINVVGGDNGSNPVGASSSCTKCVYPALTAATSLADPLSAIPAPTYSNTCDHTNVSYGNSATATLSPGVYCGGITINAATVTLNPGIYVLLGGGLQMNSAQAQLSGTGVMFYNTGSASHSFNTINIGGGGTATLSAPTSGTWSGILFFQDRTQGNSSSKNAISGGSTGNFTGALYFPTQELDYTGGSSTTTQNATFISNVLVISGSARIQSGLSYNGGTGSKIAIIE